MQNQYTEQDSQRVRQAEQSSAGRATEQLSELPVGSVVAPPRRRNNTAAIALIAVGLLALVGRGVPWMNGLSDMLPWRVDLSAGMFFLTIASCFLFFAFWKRIYGLLIPGCILSGFALGVTFVNIIGGAPFFWGLSLGFLAIYVLGRELLNVRVPWPIFPAVALFAVGTIVAVSSTPGILAGGFIWLPLLLIGAGLYLGFGRKTS